MRIANCGFRIADFGLARRSVSIRNSQSAIRNRAFTLIELVVVVALLAVMAGLIVPRMGGSLDRQEALDAASQFALTVRTAAELAVARQQRFGIEIGQEGYVVVMQSEDGGDYQAIESSWLRARRWPKSVRVLDLRTPGGAGISGDSHRLLLRADGTSSGVALRLGSDAADSSVIVNPSNSRAVVGDDENALSAQQEYDLGD